MWYKKIISFLLAFWLSANFITTNALTGDLNIASQAAVWTWSSSSVISFSTWTITQYINQNNDSETIWNYLSWYYYDTSFWFFKLDWSATWSDNVSVVASTSKCPTWYGYKLGWYAYSPYAGFIDFDYNSDIFVYYCESDSALHWFAYSENNWFQNFDWIWLNLISITTNIPAIFQNSGDPFFVNNNTLLLENKNSVFANVIQWQSNTTDTWKETIFYVLKQK